MALPSFVFTQLDCCLQEVSTWYDGFWKGGKRNTKGVQTYENGAKYEGAFCDDKREGLGRCGDRRCVLLCVWLKSLKLRYIESDGSEYVGEWKDDKRDGRGKCTLPGGGMFDGVWSQDVRHGLGTFTYPNGDIFEGEWKKDVPDTSRGVMKYKSLKLSPDANSATKLSSSMNDVRAEIGIHPCYK
jgi:hypothetical protein